MRAVSAHWLYTVGLLPGCFYFRHLEPICLMRAIFTAGWWMSFCDKRQANTLSDLVSHPRGIAGLLLIVVGIVAQFWVI